MATQHAYQRIGSHFRDLIKSGELPPGARLPTLDEIAARFDLSEIVARQAIRTLAAEGLVYTKRGRDAGTYVTEPRQRLVRVAPQRYRRGKGATTYADEAASAGVDLQRDTHTRHAIADDTLADRLAIQPGDPITETRYLIRLDRHPVDLSTTWEPLDLTQDTDIEYPDSGPHGHLGIVDRFDQIGQHVHEIEEQLTFRAATETETKTLQLPPGVGVVAIAQTFRTPDRVVAVADVVYRADSYRFLYRMPVPPVTEGGERLDPAETGDVGPLAGVLNPHDR